MVKQQNVIIAIIALVCLTGGFMSGVHVGSSRGVPFVTAQSKWSIGIYVGKSPFDFVSPENLINPVLTAEDVTDVPSDFVADPFMVKDSSTWYMFFEVMNSQTHQGDIGMATSHDGSNWIYKQIVLDELFHLSYPYVFKWKNEYYMVPESHQANSLRLYKAVDFPTKWSFVRTLLYGQYADSSIFRHAGRWWIFTETSPGDNNTLRLYYADDLRESWIEHPKSPIIEGDANIARPGGRVLVLGDRIVRYAQDDDPTYGNQVLAFEITQLTILSYEEKRVPRNPTLKTSGSGWNADGIHHIDPHQIDKNKWIACGMVIREASLSDSNISTSANSVFAIPFTGCQD